MTATDDHGRARRRPIKMGDADQSNRRRLDALADKVPGALFEFHEKASGGAELSYFNAIFPEILGVGAPVIKANWRLAMRHFKPEDLPRMQEEWDAARLQMRPLDIRLGLEHPTKGLRKVQISSIPTPDGEGGVVWYGNAFDVTEGDRVADDLRIAHARLHSITEIAPVGLFEYRRDRSGHQQFLFATERFCNLIGCRWEDLSHSPQWYLDRLEPEDLPVLARDARISARRLERWKTRYRFHHPDRGLIWLEMVSIPRRDPEEGTIWTGFLRDACEDVARETELDRARHSAEELEARNRHLAYHDVLTGLPNRRAFLEKLSSMAAQGQSEPHVLIQVDLDRFKVVNDKFGHEAGDQVLRHIADALRQSLRPNDFVARVGGDEFSILLGTPARPEFAERIVEQIRWKLRTPINLEGRTCRCSASFGIARVDTLNKDGAEVRRLADAALYRAKTSGRNRTEVGSAETEKEIFEWRQFAEELEAAVANDELEPWFEPQFSARSGEIVGFEVLVRWPHPKLGLLSCARFHPVAEELAIMPEITRIVRRKVILSLKECSAVGFRIPKISFKVRALSIQDPEIAHLIQALRAIGIPTAVALTDLNVLSEDLDGLKRDVDRLRAVGAEVGIGDFASSRLSMIETHALAPEALTIDAAIVNALAHDHGSWQIAKSIIHLAHSIGAATIAKGVETSEQATILTECDCDIFQGALLWDPVRHPMMVTLQK